MRFGDALEYVVHFNTRPVPGIFDKYISPYIKQQFNIGSFNSWLIDIPCKSVSKLKKFSFFLTIVPNTQIQAFDIDSSGLDYSTQSDSSRHLARISRRSKLPYSSAKNTSLNFYYPSKYLGTGVNVYVLDSGIRTDHPDFENRVIQSVDFTNSSIGDRLGHGTHVAGLVGSKTFGVAKNVSLVDVKVLDDKGNGNVATVMKGLDFVVQHCKDTFEENRKCVANLSFGAVQIHVLRKAVEEAIKEGIVMVGAAGNREVNACWITPASTPGLITVGSFDDRDDTLASFSNWGRCVDIFAPGVYIKSLSLLSIEHSTESSGTSMSAPLVAGLAAILLSDNKPPNEIKNIIRDLAIPGIFNDSELKHKPGTPNLILNIGINKQDDYYPEGLFSNEKGLLKKPTRPNMLFRAPKHLFTDNLEYIKHNFKFF